MNPKAKESWDLVAIIVLSGLLILSILLVPEFPLRIVIGLPFLLFFPGYALIAFLFPDKKSLDTIERIALSFGLSIAITPLIGFGLNYTPFGIRLDPILASETAFIVAFCLLAYWRRYKVEERYLPFDPIKLWNSATGQYKKEGKLDRALTIILVIAILSSVISLAYVVAFPRQGEKFTEFYILGPGHNATGYPHNLTVGQNASVFIGIKNHEGRQVHYYVQVWLVNASFVNNQTIIYAMYYLDQFDTVLNNTPVNLDGPWTPQYERNYTFSIPIAGQFKLWFFLFKDAVPPYAENLTYMQDCAGGPTDQLLYAAVANDASVLLSLNLNLSIRTID
jgi:uncharacterized membrane protein